MWWHTVHIGSLLFPKWSAVGETLALQECRALFQNGSNAYLVVVKSMEPLDVIGVISPASLDTAMKDAGASDVENYLKLPVAQVKSLISPSFKLLPIPEGILKDLDDAFSSNFGFVILTRTTRNLTLNESGAAKVGEKIHPISVVSRADVQRWILSVENHHNTDNAEGGYSKMFEWYLKC